MDSWVPPRQPQPRGRHAAWMEGRDRGPWRELSLHARHNSEWFQHQYPDPRVGPPPWPDGRVEYRHPIYHPWLQDYSRPNSRAEYYESNYPKRSYSRQGHDDLYWNPVDHYAYGDNQRNPQALQSERDPRQRDTWSEHTHHQDQSHYNCEDGSSYNNATLLRSKKPDSYVSGYDSKRGDSYDASYTSSLQQGWIQDNFQGNFLENVSAQANELPLPEESSLLQQYKESGLSSSSYELSQYMYDSSGHDASKDWSPIQAAEDLPATPHPVAPQKFSIPHVPVCFGAGGKLVRGCPNYPAEGQPALIEIHSLEVILHDSPEQEAMRVFPGPLIREDLHKVDVMAFCQCRAAMGSDLASSRGRDSALLWKLLLLLCRQNGSMVGSDTAELLMQDCRHRERYKRQEPAANLIHLTDEEWPMQGYGTTDLLTGEIVPSVATPQQKVEKFTKLLFYGRKKEALDWAMRNQLWGHALFLSSKMDQRTYSWVLNGFTSTLAFHDPLQTLFQLMSERIPQASLCCGDEKWGDWRPHLAVILSNQTGDAELNRKAIITMGETLARKGLIEAAHFCYLTANIPFGHYGVKTDHMVLLGSSQSQTFAQFAKSESIHGTEVFEYCQLLGHPQAFIPSFQVYKLIYASRLVDYGLTAQALHYCEGVGMALLAQNQNIYPVLLEQVIKLAERLKLSDPCLLERPDQEVTLEPDWLIELRARHQQWEEECLPSATSVQPELPRVSESIPGLTPHSEFAQSQGCWEDLRQHPSSHQLPMASTQHLPAIDQRLYFHSESRHPTDTAVATPEAFPPGISQHSISSPEEVPEDPSPFMYQPTEGLLSPPCASGAGPGTSLGLDNSHIGLGSCATPRLLPLISCAAEGRGNPEVLATARGDTWGGTVESHGPYHIPGDQKNFLEHQNILNVRTRTVSESSTISMVEDVPQSPDDTGEEAASKRSSVEDDEQEQVKASSFGWFRWFRSKPNKDAEPSKKVPAAPSDFAAPVSQEKAAPPSCLSSVDGTRPPSLPPSFSHLPHKGGNLFPQSSIGAKNRVGLSSREGAMFPYAGDQVTTRTASAAGHPPQIFQ